MVTTEIQGGLDTALLNTEMYKILVPGFPEKFVMSDLAPHPLLGEWYGLVEAGNASPQETGEEEGFMGFSYKI